MEGHIANIFREDKTDLVSPLAGNKCIFIPILKEQKTEISREKSSHFNPEDGGSELFWDAGIHILDYSVITWKATSCVVMRYTGCV
jgi:hypothetical protein